MPRRGNRRTLSYTGDLRGGSMRGNLQAEALKADIPVLGNSYLGKFWVDV